jgi:hypothetical protein
MTDSGNKSSYGDGLSKIIKQALDAGFIRLAYCLLTLASIAILLMLTSGHAGDGALDYFRYLLDGLALAASAGIIYEYFSVSTANASRLAIDATSENSPPSA